MPGGRHGRLSQQTNPTPGTRRNPGQILIPPKKICECLRTTGVASMTEQRDRSSELGVDLPELLARVDNDRDLLSELIGIFKEEFPRLLQELQQSVAGEDVKKVVATSHALKG